MKNLAPLVPNKSIQGIIDLLLTTYACPSCGAGIKNLIPKTDQEALPVYTIQCGYCDYMGPWAANLESAIISWNWGKPGTTPPKRQRP